MTGDDPLAHSPKGAIPPQTYYDHVSNVRSRAVSNIRQAAAFYTGDARSLVQQVEAASIYHDLGKLDRANQDVLKKKSRMPLPIAHEDAGVAELDGRGWQEAAILSHGHHDGLFSRSEELSKQGRPFRELRHTTPEGHIVADHVDLSLGTYEVIHANSGCPTLEPVEAERLHEYGFTRRIALSCLVDADHGDTARHYGNEVETPLVEPRWIERLAALERYVNTLPEGKTEAEKARNRLRKQMLDACRDAPVDPAMRSCDAPVGSGKTTAVMAHLLRVAAERRPQLRHIIVVLPYTNIITQSVDVYRKAVVLDGERSEDVVAEHHHRADFEDLELRQLATLWKAPVIVTTAVQFFETLGAYHPANLRKLHELPGSAVFVDEMHAAIPSRLWPQMWRWLEAWVKDWGGHLVLASGSLARFWELDEYREAILFGEKQKGIALMPDLVTDEALRRELKKAEERRIKYRRRPENADALDCAGIIEFITNKQGPRLLIVNTVQTAAVIAEAMKALGHDVLHLSTALAPAHRDLVIERVRIRLRDRIQDWTLIATSCVEAGMNFSFQNGFRERASTSSLIQIGGRINRGSESTNAEVWDLLLRDDLFRENPSMSIARRALGYFETDELNRMSPSVLATTAMRREWTSGSEEKAARLIELEKSMEYPEVSKECRVIETDTRTVIIDRSLVDAIRKGKKVSKTELMKYSVQIWADKIKKLALDPVLDQVSSSDSSMFFWQYEYEPDFLGYMKGVLTLEKFIAAGGAII